MFFGREKELAVLERLFTRARTQFQMAVVYGRRRVGKTALLAEFSRNKRSLFFTAQQKSNPLNLRSFSRALYELAGMPPSAGAFETWDDALSFLAETCRAAQEPTVIVFDEFPYAAQSEPSLPSSVQIAIDHLFANVPALLILCGSNEGFMESEVLGSKSPLFGRRNAQIRLRPFDYLDASRFIPYASPEDLIKYYATFGGTPYYLEQIDPQRSYRENVESLFFDLSGILYAEPEMLLRQELREPANYSSILDAVGSGATIPKAIAERAGVEEAHTRGYLSTLVDLGLIRRDVSFGENPLTSRKGLYSIADPFFAYWYRFVSPNIGSVEAGAGSLVADRATNGEALSTYIGQQFELVCMQWVQRQNALGRLPLLASSFGKWWGTDPVARERADIDLIAANLSERIGLFGECKWRNVVNESEALETLERRACAVKGIEQRTFALFTKEAASEGTRKKADARDDLMLVCAEDLF